MKIPCEGCLNIDVGWPKTLMSQNFAVKLGWASLMAALNPQMVKMRLEARLETDGIWVSWRGFCFTGGGTWCSGCYCHRWIAVSHRILTGDLAWSVFNRKRNVTDKSVLWPQSSQLEDRETAGSVWLEASKSYISTAKGQWNPHPQGSRQLFRWLTYVPEETVLYNCNRRKSDCFYLPLLVLVYCWLLYLKCCFGGPVASVLVLMQINHSKLCQWWLSFVVKISKHVASSWYESLFVVCCSETWQLEISILIWRDGVCCPYVQKYF